VSCIFCSFDARQCPTNTYSCLLAQILAKGEFLNPGGSIKDRVAVQIFKEAMESGQLDCGDLITEGTAGSTGISLAMVAASYGVKCHIVLPDDVATEKAELLQVLGGLSESNPGLGLPCFIFLRLFCTASASKSPRCIRNDDASLP
jgi:cysteine synthase